MFGDKLSILADLTTPEYLTLAIVILAGLAISYRKRIL